MPSRRQFIASAGAAAAVGLAGCSAGVASPSYEGWLYDPQPVLGRNLPWRGFLSADVQRAWDRREQLPEEWVATVTTFDRGVDSVDRSDLDRLTAQGFGTVDLTTAGVTAALTGAIEQRAVVREFARGSTVVEHEPVAGHRLFGYVPPFMGRIRRDGAVTSGSLGLAVAEGQAVVGGLLAPDDRAATPVAAMVRAGTGTGGVAGPERPLRSVGRALADSPLGLPPVVGGVAFEEALATRLSNVIPEEWPTLAAVVDDLRAIGIGLRFGPERTLTEFVLVYDPRAIAENENLRAAADKLTDRSSNPNSGVLGVRLGPGGRSLVVRTTVSPRTVWADFRSELPGV
jgi:hypothetical protein